jgi:3-dehydroquinate dehydratase
MSIRPASTLTGFGIHSYILGLDGMLEILKKKTTER